MSDPAETIHTPQLRFKVATAAAGDQEIKPSIPEETARQPTVVDEQSLASLSGHPAAKEKSVQRPWTFI